MTLFTAHYDQISKKLTSHRPIAAHMEATAPQTPGAQLASNASNQNCETKTENLQSVDMDSSLSATGETSLPRLLSNLKLSVHPSTFVFLNFPPSTSPPPRLVQHMPFHEIEGLTVITTLASALEHGLDYTFPSRMITCNVHSSLQAVGFIVKISQVLTEKGIGVNPVSGFYHDHLFVPMGREQDATAALESLITQDNSVSDKAA